MNKLTAFIVDDDVNFCNILLKHFSEHPRFDTVNYAHDGLNALDYIKLNKPHIIVLDLILPVFDGLYIINHIHREMEDYKPFIYVVSALGSEKTNKIMTSLNVDYYSVKPISPQVVVENALSLISLIESPVLRARQGALDVSADPSGFYSDPPFLNIERHVEEYLSKLGAPIYRLSTRCTSKLIQLAIEDTTALHSMLQLYATTGQTLVPTLTGAAVERNIRSTVKYITDHPTDYFYECFTAEPKKVRNNIFINNSVYLIKKKIERFLVDKDFLK